MIGRCAIVLALLVHVAAAEDTVKASEHFARGDAAEKQGNLELAAREFEQAYDAAPHPSPLYRAATVYDRMDKRREAATTYQRYLDAAPTARDADKVRARIDELEHAPAEVAITSKPAGATVFVDGEPRGKTPLTLTLASGKQYPVLLERDGARTKSRPALPQYGERVELDFDLAAASVLDMSGQQQPQQPAYDVPTTTDPDDVHYQGIAVTVGITASYFKRTEQAGYHGRVAVRRADPDRDYLTLELGAFGGVLGDGRGGGGEIRALISRKRGHSLVAGIGGSGYTVHGPLGHALLGLEERAPGFGVSLAFSAVVGNGDPSATSDGGPYLTVMATASLFLGARVH